MRTIVNKHGSHVIETMKKNIEGTLCPECGQVITLQPSEEYDNTPYMNRISLKKASTFYMYFKTPVITCANCGCEYEWYSE